MRREGFDPVERRLTILIVVGECAVALAALTTVILEAWQSHWLTVVWAAIAVWWVVIADIQRRRADANIRVLLDTWGDR